MAVTITLRENYRGFINAFEYATAEGLQRAGLHYHSACRRAVNRSNARNRRSGQYDNPSKPGEPPRARTGFGRDNIVFEFNDNLHNPAVRVGVIKNALYMFHLEHGFSVPAHTIEPKSGKWLKIPWRGPVKQYEAKSGKQKASVIGRTRKGLKKFLALPAGGEPFVVYGEHGTSGGYFYFRRKVDVDAFQVAARPWMLPTLNAEKTRLAMLAATGGRRRIA